VGLALLVGEELLVQGGLFLDLRHGRAIVFGAGRTCQTT
jgi:hypothetical protein